MARRSSIASVKNNIGAVWDRDHGDIDAAFADAPVVAKARIRSQRLSGVPMEARAVVATPDPLINGITVWTSTQAPHWNRNSIADALGLPATRVRAVAPEVGGGFGVKIGAYQEDFIVAALAFTMRRPLKWIETRSENFLATNHGRDQWADVEIAAELDGRIRGLRMHVVQDLGGFPRGTDLAELTGRMSSGCYDIPALEFRSRSVYTNKMALGAYRGAGRPEAAYYVERAIDLLADAAGLDPVEVRRRNFIAPFENGYTTASGEKYDTGDYAKALDYAVEVSGYEALRAEQAAARKNGRYLGIGLASYVEICGFGPFESATVRVETNGDVTVYTGISPHGQGQETSFAQIVADGLGVPMEKIGVNHGDTLNTPQGNGTMGSRGLAVGGGAVVHGAGQGAGPGEGDRRASAGGGGRGHRDRRGGVPGARRAGPGRESGRDRRKGVFRLAAGRVRRRVWRRPSTSAPTMRRSRSAPTSRSSKSFPRRVK